MSLRKKKRKENVINHLIYLIKMIYKNRHCFEVQTRLIEFKNVYIYKRRRIIDFNRS